MVPFYQSWSAAGLRGHARIESPPRSGLEIFTLLLVFLAAALWKSPTLFVDPRFWAEEGTVFYVNFLHSSFFDSIFYVYRGSFQLFTNVIVYAAAQVSWELAPTVTTYAALALHLIVVVQIGLFVKAHDLGRLVGLLLVGSWALLPQTYEVWLTATNAQWVAGVSVLMVFVMPSNWIARHYGGAALWCFVCGLAGVPATLLAPVFVLRAVIERSGPIGIVAAALAATALIQIAILAAVGEQRPYPLDPLTLVLPLFLQSVLAPVISTDGAVRLGSGIVSQSPETAARALIATLTLGLVVMGCATAAGASARRKPDAWLVLLAGICVTAVQNFGAIAPHQNLSGWANPRYFLCGSMCLCLLLGWGTRARPTLLRSFSFGLLCAIVLLGIATAAANPSTDVYIRGPSWHRQINACVPGQMCKVRVWPLWPSLPDWWTLELRK
jgi:hypothetical protein